MAIRQIALAAVFFQFFFVPVAAADGSRACFYLDQRKVQGEIMPVVFLIAGACSKIGSIRLDKNGLFQVEERLCQWSLNGGSGTKEQFSLDGDFAVPILDTACEAPFSHEYTGVGFGDWYLILCGTVSSENLYLSYRDIKYYAPVESLKQWTRFKPGEFPIKGDEGY